MTRIGATSNRKSLATAIATQKNHCDSENTSNTAISVRFLGEKLAISKLWLAIASDVWLRLRGSRSLGRRGLHPDGGQELQVTPLTSAAQFGNSECVEALLEAHHHLSANADYDQQNHCTAALSVGVGTRWPVAYWVSGLRPRNSWHRPKRLSVLGRGAGGNKNASEMRQKCVKSASKWVLFDWERGNAPKCVRNTWKMRQKCAEHLWGRTPFRRYRNREKKKGGKPDVFGRPRKYRKKAEQM